jgi:hypothetical protein
VNRKTFMLLFGLVLVFAQGTVLAAEADLTRYLAKYERGEERPDVSTHSFFGTAGPATLVVTADDVSNARISINGIQVLGPKDLKKRDEGKIQVPVTLLAGNNSIQVALKGKDEGSLTVRVKQHVNVDYQVVDYLTYSGPTRNYELSEAFYADLGWTTGIKFPDTNTLAVAAELGIDHVYDIHVELRILTHGQALSFIDLIEFFDPVRGIQEKPYPFLYHLGMTHIAYVTTDLDADYSYLSNKGVQFLSAPVGKSGERFGRFATFKDLDGTFIQLVEVPNPGPGPTACDPKVLPPSSFPAYPFVTDDPPVFYPCPKTHLVRPQYVDVNVSDFEGAREFFRMLGFANEKAPAGEKHAGRSARHGSQEAIPDSRRRPDGARQHHAGRRRRDPPHSVA